MLKRWGTWILAIGAIPLAVCAYDRLFGIKWVGAIDLDIEFVVKDGVTGKPVDGAKIAVVSEGGFYHDKNEKGFTLVTDQDGTAHRVCRDSMCYGTRSKLGFTDTYVVHLPWWEYRASAPTFEPSESFVLDVPEFARQVRRVGPRAAELVVPVSVTKYRESPTNEVDKNGNKNLH